MPKAPIPQARTRILPSHRAFLCAIPLALAPLAHAGPSLRAELAILASEARRLAATLTEPAADPREAIDLALDRAAERLRQRARDEAADRFGLFDFNPDADLPWMRIPDELPDRVVLLVHGLDETGGIWSDLAPALHDAGHTVVRFDYPNDQPITRSAESLARALDELSSRGVTRVDVVAHSMGGLVTREAITRPAFAPSADPVERLITIGTPHHGAPLARLRIVAELRDQAVQWATGARTGSILTNHLADGAGEAGRDLTPGSPFLEDLNARTLPERIRCTSIVGCALPRSLSRLAPQGLSGAILALGDGVVPDDATTLDGVDDVVRVDAHHRAMLTRTLVDQALAPDPDAPPPAIPIILDRLEQDAL